MKDKYGDCSEKFNDELDRDDEQQEYDFYISEEEQDGE